MEQTTPAGSEKPPFIDESIDDVGASTSRYLKHHPWSFAIPLAIAAILDVVIFVFFRPTDGHLLFVYFMPFFWPLITRLIVQSKIQHEFMQQFAAANGFSYSPKGSLAGLDGSLFKVGDNKSVADVVSGQFQSQPLSLFTYTYETGSGKSRQTHNYTVYELQFDIVLPDMLLESASHGYGGSLYDKITGKELVKLEGDFNKYFSLNISKGYEVEALEIFTPDVMEELIEKAKAFSLEIVNGHLFIYDNGIVGTKQGLYDLYGLAQYFIEKLGPTLARMKPSVGAMEQYQK